MRSVFIDGANVVTINDTEYYYENVTVNNGSYIIVLDRECDIIVDDYLYDTYEFTDDIRDGELLLNGFRVYHAELAEETIKLAVRKEIANPHDMPSFLYIVNYDETDNIINYTIPEFQRVVQLEDKKHYPVTPYTSARGVIHEDGFSFQWVADILDEEKIEEAKDEALIKISGSTIEAVIEIKEAIREYKEPFEALSGMIPSLDSAIYPLDIDYDITSDFSSDNLVNTISVNISEHPGLIANVDRFYIEKFVNGTSVGKIYDQTNPPTSITMANTIQGMKEEFVFVASGGDKTTEIKGINYLLFYGTTNSQTITSSDVMNLNKILLDGIEFNTEIETERGEYVWIIVPEYLSINTIKCSGFGFSILEPTYLNVDGLGRYKCYRSNQELDETIWNLIIN